MATLKRKISDIISRSGFRVSRIRKRGEENFPSYVEEEFIQLYKRYFDASMVPWQGIHDAYRAAKFIAKNNVEGDVVECGVWRGGVSALMKDTLIATSTHSPRKLWLFDTFEGMSDPTEYDFKGGRNFQDTLAKHQSLLNADGSSNWCRGEIEDVQRTLDRTENGLVKTELVKGMVEETLDKSNLPKKIAILRLDTDFYESTKKEFEMLFPRLVKGGVLIVDDFGAWAGARKAAQEYLNTHKHERLVLFNNHFYGALIGVKVFD